MKRDMPSASAVDAQKAKSYEDASGALKCMAFGMKKIPNFLAMSHGAKLLAAVTNGFSHYHKGERADVAAAQTMIDLGFSTVFMPYRVARFASPVLTVVGLKEAAIFLKSILDEFDKTIATVLINPNNVPLWSYRQMLCMDKFIRRQSYHF